MMHIYSVHEGKILIHSKNSTACVASTSLWFEKHLQSAFEVVWLTKQQIIIATMLKICTSPGHCFIYQPRFYPVLSPSLFIRSPFWASRHDGQMTPAPSVSVQVLGLSLPYHNNLPRVPPSLPPAIFDSGCTNNILFVGTATLKFLFLSLFLNNLFLITFKKSNGYFFHCFVARHFMLFLAAIS